MTNTITPLRVEVKCFGKYTFKITDPAVFMREVAGTADVYYKDDICEQMRSEVQASFQKVLNELGNSENKAPVLELPSYTDKIKEIMDKKVFDQNIRDRGMSIKSFIIESVTLDEESNRKIDNYELSSNNYMQQGAIVGGMSKAVVDAANNSNGAATGMMGVGMVNMASNGMMNNAMGAAFGNTEGSKADLSGEQKKETSAPAGKMNFCPNCGTKASGKFCSNCGTKLE